MSSKYPGGWVPFAKKGTPIAPELTAYLKRGNWEIVAGGLKKKGLNAGGVKGVLETIVQDFPELSLYDLPSAPREIVEQTRGIWREHMGR